MTTAITYENFMKSYEIVTSYWPIELDVSEQYKVGQRGYRIPNLSAAHDAVESEISDQYDSQEHDILIAIEFALFTQLHNKIRDTRQTSIAQEDMSLDDVKAIFNSYDAWEIIDNRSNQDI